jgi:hypothetical protein
MYLFFYAASMLKAARLIVLLTSGITIDTLKAAGQGEWLEEPSASVPKNRDKIKKPRIWTAGQG